MKLKHTKGPWYNKNIEFFAQDILGICATFNDDKTEAKANARLISCAPEFLEDKIKDYKEIGKWLSAALEDDKVCVEMKQDIIMWFKRFDTFEKATGFKIEEVIE